MSSQATKYKILIASPSDVVEERKVIPDVIKDWNTANSDYYGVILEAVLWETHAIPEMGKRPQASLNKQFEDCDILIAIFWTRLGTPTGKANSGTIEEIEEFKKAVKPVSLYFSLKPIPPKILDTEQYDKLSKTIKQYETTEGLIVNYESIDVFRSKLNLDITKKINFLHGSSIKVRKESDADEVQTKRSDFATNKSKEFIEAIVEPNEILKTTINPRVFDEKKLPPLGSAQLSSYKWSAQNFEGFWYDFIGVRLRDES